MKSMFRFTTRVLAVMGVVAITSCGQSTFTRVAGKALNMGQVQGDEMVNVTRKLTVANDS
jgi:hypothetical protein